MGLFGNNIQEKTSSGARLPTYYGNHRVRLGRCQRREGHEGLSSIVEFTIVKSDNLQAVNKESSWVMNFTKGGKDAIAAKEGNLSDFTSAGLESGLSQKGVDTSGEPRDQYDRLKYSEEDLGDVFLEEQILLDVYMDVSVIEATSKAGNKFPVYKWRVTKE